MGGETTAAPPPLLPSFHDLPTHVDDQLSTSPHLLSQSTATAGVASQEVVKLITHQYIPMCHTLVFNGIAGDSTTFAF